MALDPERLSSLDEFGDRVKIIPAEVKGYFRRHRDGVYAMLLMIFLLLPWISVGGEQAILLDVGSRRFAIFGVVFWAHDAPLIFFILATLTLGLAFVTSLWGRVWCGWACPQTVFIDVVFRRIERWVQGNYIQRRQLDAAPFSAQKFFKFSLTWFLFFVASSLIAHSFVAYFVGSSRLIQMIQGNPEQNWSYFLLITVMTLLVLFDFGWFREQFCIIMCPYGRFQSVLLDQKSLGVVYDTARGEPRKGSVEAQAGKKGDCVSCNRCVQVCPTGIDIRKGLQLECIACTACIDACDEIMEKVHKPQGLIRYDSQDQSKFSLLRPRSLAYMALILLAVAGLAYNVITRDAAQIFVLRAKESPYTLIPGPEIKILNHFRLQIQNQSHSGAEYRLVLPEDWTAKNIVLTQGQNVLTLKSGEMAEWHFFVTFPEKLLPAKGQLATEVILETAQEGRPLIFRKELILIGPQSFGGGH